MIGPVLIVDGLNVFLRAYAVVPQLDASGGHVGGTIGFVRSLKAVMRDVRPSLVVVAWDGEGGSRRRRGIYAEYKAGRRPRTNRHYDFGEGPSEGLRDMETQLARLKGYLDALGVAQVTSSDTEADDLIAHMARWVLGRGELRVIMSGDRDMLQLVDADTRVYSSAKKLYYGVDEVRRQFGGVPPENLVLYRALQGSSDSSDNIKGIRGFGPKKVLRLFPFLAEERTCDLREVLDWAHVMAQVEGTGKKGYQEVVANVALVEQNVRLMQLSSPEISPATSRACRAAIEQLPQDPSMTAFRLGLLRDGVQLADSDMFTVFEDYRTELRKRRESRDGAL